MPVDFSVTNQLSSPAIYASSFATRPAASFKGRLFVDTNVPSTGIYRDTGTAWVAIAGTGVAETQNLNQVCTIGNSTASLGIIIFGDTAIGSYLDDGIPVQYPTFEGYALSIGGYAGTGYSIYTLFDCDINNVHIGRGGGNNDTNTVFGKIALSTNDTGIRNTAIGNSTLKLNTEGNENTAIGFRTLEYNVLGSYNTILGSSAGAQIIEGLGNTLLGYGTNVTGDDDDYNVVIGYNTIAPVGNNQFVIGNATQNAGSVTTEVNASTRVWNVVINGVARKILLA